MKQSNIISFFDHGRMRKGATSGSSQYGRMSNREKFGGRDIFPNKDPSLIYQNMLKKEQQQFKVSTVDNAMMEADLSSQSSSQLFPNSQNSLSHIINSSESNDTPWIPEMADSRYHASNPYRGKQRNFRQMSNWNTNASSHDINKYFDDFKRRAKEKDDREMIATFITLVKECCDETKAAVSANCDKCEGRVTQGITSALEKVETLAKKWENMESLLKTKEAYEEKVRALEIELLEKTTEISNLRRELNDVHEKTSSEMIEKLSEVFDKGQKIQSEKIGDLVSKASDIQTILEKPKLITADMWSQYSPRLDHLSSMTLSKISLQPLQRMLPSPMARVHNLPTSNSGCFNLPTQNYFSASSVQKQPLQHSTGVYSSTAVFDNLASDSTSSSHEPGKSVVGGISSIVKPVNNFAFSNQHHFAMRSPMPQCRVAFGNIKKDSPVMAVKPFVQNLKHDTAGVHTNFDCALTRTVSEAQNVQTSSSQWHALAKLQKDDWFARSTRSARRHACLAADSSVVEDTSSAIETRMPPPVSIPKKTKAKRAKRKKTNFVRKRRSKQTTTKRSKTAVNAVAQDEFHMRDDVLDISCSDKKNERRILTTPSSRSLLTNVNVKYESRVISEAPAGIKQEAFSPVTPFRVARSFPQKAWHAVLDSDVDSCDADGVIFLGYSDDNKENKAPPSKSNSVDWAGFCF